MPQINEERRKFESAFLNDFWSFRKENWEPVDTDEYWTTVVQKIDEIAKKYKLDKYVQEILLVVVNDLELRARQKTGENAKRFTTINLLNRWRREQGLPPAGGKKVCTGQREGDRQSRLPEAR